ncbi:metalloregulator ArsR/SmtB family transcription factor [Vibrio sp. WXL103]|uniref:metalloregulator ArsR/SmtB family transcription factor n=1 Tax=unclassified Vibrio TaxID=2614977 RepID=UPI003EC55270
MLPHQFFKLLSDETRVRCLLLIAREENGICVGELTEAIQESQPKVSRHLAQLRAQGLVRDERRGQWVYYHLAENLPGWAKKVINDIAASNCLKAEYQQDLTRLQGMNRASCCD